MRVSAGLSLVALFCLIAGMAVAEPREIDIPETLEPGDRYELLVRSSQVRFGQNAGVQQAVSTARVSMTWCLETLESLSTRSLSRPRPTLTRSPLTV